ncbi:MAG: FAD-dependent oxidoreductase, partial [Caldilineae bacterium]
MNHHIAVVGLGLIGSAALRHLSNLGLSPLGLGPDEPKDWQAHQGVFASHYDQGRITRVLDPDPIWALAAERSIARYPDIAAAGGAAFHHPVGCLRATPDAADPTDTVNAAAQVGRERQVAFTSLDGAGLRETFPYWRFPPDATGLWEQGPAGYINPRELVQAQLAAAVKGGATVQRETVVQVERQPGGYRLHTDAGTIHQVERVLIASGAFTNLLLERPLDLRPKAVAVLLAQVNAAERERLRGMPSLIYRLPQHPTFYSIYALPPIPYPDGHTYLKIGSMDWETPLLHSREDFLRWFHGQGDPARVQGLRAVLLDLLPGLQVASFHSVPCVLTYTASGYP